MPRKKKPRSWFGISLLLVSFALASAYLVFHIRSLIQQSTYFSSKNTSGLTEELKLQHVFRNFEEGSLGIDVSEYQGKINFPGLQLQLENHRVEFVFIRASMGADGVDKMLRKNWDGFSNMPVKRGAYHYYRPNENSTRQAQNFIKAVSLQPGDLVPVLDIEKHATIQTRDKLREGLKNWLRIVEEHYGVKPMIYTGDRFFWEVLHNEGFDQYPIWVANYNLIMEPETENWLIWQFTEKGTLPGIRGKVDLNILRGGSEQLQSVLIPH